MRTENGLAAVLAAAAQPAATVEVRTEAAAASSEMKEGSWAGVIGDERARSKKILGSEAAKGRETLAQHLAFETDMSAEAAIATLETAPKAEAPKSASRLDQAMQNFQPKVDTQEQTTEADRVSAGLNAAVVRQIKKHGKTPVTSQH